MAKYEQLTKGKFKVNGRSVYYKHYSMSLIQYILR